MYRDRASSGEENAKVTSLISMMAVGDIMLGESPLRIGHGVASKVRDRGAIFPFLKVASFLTEGDIVFGNLETVLSNWGVNNRKLKTLQMRAAPEAVEGLKYAGFNILSLANNHIFEHGQEALYETIDLLSRNGIKYIGVIDDESKVKKPLLLCINGITTAFLAYCLIPDKTDYSWVQDPEEICSDVRKAKGDSDILIVSLHWGDEFIRRPSPAQVKLAHSIIDSGANLILGHHPHVLQGIEEYRNGVIVYSLGNLIFDMWQERMRVSVILHIYFSKKGISSVEMLPVYINGDYQPEFMPQNKAHDLLVQMENLSSGIMAGNLSSSDNNSREYVEEAATCRKRYRRELKNYFIKNIYRYPPRFALQMVIEYLSKKLK